VTAAASDFRQKKSVKKCARGERRRKMLQGTVPHRGHHHEVQVKRSRQPTRHCRGVRPRTPEQRLQLKTWIIDLR
jgi:hypothetical protein